MKCKQLLVIVFLPVSFFSAAQVKTTGYIDFGSNQAETPVYIRSGVLGNYQWKNTRFEAGFLMNLKSENDLFLSGYRLKTSYDFNIKQKPFSAQAFFVQKYDEMLRETNWGIDIEKQWKHIDLTLGTWFKVYAFRDEAINEYGIDSENEKLKEPFNLLYSFKYRLKENGNQWNAAIGVTNFDFFIYSQETNPLFNLQGYYQFTPSVTLFTEAWFEFSGIFNINASYFGYYVRSGITINLNKL